MTDEKSLISRPHRASPTRRARYDILEFMRRVA
jgi:hypothetical protein